jgi:hypothetical protein
MKSTTTASKLIRAWIGRFRRVIVSGSLRWPVVDQAFLSSSSLDAPVNHLKSRTRVACRCEVLSYPTSGPDEVLVTRALGVVGGEDGRIERLG